MRTGGSKTKTERSPLLAQNGGGRMVIMGPSKRTLEEGRRKRMEQDQKVGGPEDCVGCPDVEKCFPGGEKAETAGPLASGINPIEALLGLLLEEGDEEDCESINVECGCGNTLFDGKAEGFIVFGPDGEVTPVGDVPDLSVFDEDGVEVFSLATEGGHDGEE
jgi:hypothetical protein